MMAKQPKKKRRLVKGKDYDGWALKSPCGFLYMQVHSSRALARDANCTWMKAVKVKRVGEKLVEVK